MTRMRLSGDAQAKEWLHLVRGEEVFLSCFPFFLSLRLSSSFFASLFFF